MKPFVWKEGMSLEDTKNGAYWERNMLAVFLAQMSNEYMAHFGVEPNAGWYYHGEWEGWSRVISIAKGSATFHIPDDFDVGDLPQIEPNWDGHTTEQKWENIMKLLGMKVDK